MRRGDRRACWAAGVLMMTLPVAAWFSGEAKADPTDLYAAQNAPRVCRVLDSFPNFNGIGGIADAIVNETNLSYAQAGEVIAVSVLTVCPRHQGLINDFVATYAQGGRTYATKVGGGVR